jgi:hypothetical protein
VVKEFFKPAASYRVYALFSEFHTSKATHLPTLSHSTFSHCTKANSLPQGQSDTINRLFKQFKTILKM